MTFLTPLAFSIQFQNVVYRTLLLFILLSINIAQASPEVMQPRPAQFKLSTCFKCHVDARHLSVNPSGDINVHYGATDKPEGTLGGRMVCVDCHSSLVSLIEFERHISQTKLTPHNMPKLACQDCHGTLKTPPLIANKTNYNLLTKSDQSSFPNIKQTKDGLLLKSVTMRELDIIVLSQRAKNDSWSSHKVKQLKMESAHNEKLQCMDCHSDWAPVCYGCHAN